MNAFSFEEKRKKNYLHSIFNYTLSSLSFFDFASFDLLQKFCEIEILKSKIKPKALSDVFMFSSFFIQKKSYLVDHYLKKFLKNYTKDFKEEKSKISFFEKISLKKSIDEYNYLFSKEFNEFFENSVKKAYSKYKYPIITSEIFLLTCIIETPTFFKNVLKLILKKQKQWFIFQYKFIRHLYFRNITLDKLVNKNLHYYSYLLEKSKKNLSIKVKIKKKKKKNLKNFLKNLKSLFFKKRKLKKIPMKTNSLLIFRFILINFLLKLNFQRILEDDILLTSKERKGRKYTSF